jgi:Fungal specific transcription factor domain
MQQSAPLAQFQGDMYFYVLDSPYEDWATELFLMHHYSTVTALSVTSVSKVQELFQQHIPRIAIQHQFLMHAILSIAAIHLSELQPLLSDRYQLLHMKQHHLALSSMRQALANICEDNCSALVAAASLIIIITLYEFSHDTMELYENIGDSTHVKIMQIFSTLQGIRSIYNHNATGPTSVPITVLAGAYKFQALPAVTLSCELSNRIDALRSLIRSVSFGNERRIAFETTIMILESLYAECEDGLQRDTVPGKALSSFFEIPADYVSSLQEGHPVAHVIFAHFVILVATGDIWYLAGMSFKALDIIKRTLDDKCSVWLWWPEKQLRTNLAAFRPQEVIETEEFLDRR